MNIVNRFGHVCFRSRNSAPIFDPVCLQPYDRYLWCVAFHCMSPQLNLYIQTSKKTPKPFTFDQAIVFRPEFCLCSCCDFAFDPDALMLRSRIWNIPNCIQQSVTIPNTRTFRWIFFMFLKIFIRRQVAGKNSNNNSRAVKKKIQCQYSVDGNIATASYNHVDWTQQNLDMKFVRRRST